MFIIISKQYSIGTGVPDIAPVALVVGPYKALAVARDILLSHKHNDWVSQVSIYEMSPGEMYTLAEYVGPHAKRNAAAVLWMHPAEDSIVGHFNNDRIRNEAERIDRRLGNRNQSSKEVVMPLG